MPQRAQTKAVHLRISGRVQGVLYRAWTVDEATRRKLDGWVRNRWDGTVEAVLSGPAALVDEMVAACREGPPAAKVTEIEETPAQEAVLDEPLGPGFRALPTA